MINIYRPHTKFAKVMFLHLSVSHSVLRGEGACMVTGGHAWLGGVFGCRGVHGCGGHAWLWGVCMVVGGACVVVEGMHGCGVCAWLWGGCAWLWGVCVVAGGMHGIR